MVVNVTSIYYQKQKLQSILDQAVMLGTNYIDSNSYYNNSILNTLNLDENLVKQQIHDLPFEIPFKFVKINATSSAKLMLD